MKKIKLILFIFLPIAVNTNAGFGVGTHMTDASTLPDISAMDKTCRYQGERHIGERYVGGIVFYIYDNGHHGLIASIADQNAGIPWYNGLTRYAGTESDGLGAGAANTKIIISKLRHDDEKGNYAAKACADYSVKIGNTVYTDWYLPSKFELSLLYQQKKIVGGFANTNYWSSTEYKMNSVWIQYFGNGHQRISNSESYANAVRAIRAF